MDLHSRRPPLSILVPKTPSNRSDLPSPTKQKRLFPIACRVVPTDQWFTTRIDRTWSVQDLKIWLLSKVLPPHVLPLPASYRPSSPVTFAAAPPTATEITNISAYSDSYSFDDTVIEGRDDINDILSESNSGDRPDPNPTPLSIPYSYKTGAPAISGIAALKNRHFGPPALAHSSSSVTDDLEFVRCALQIAERWSLYSFSMGGMQLVETFPLSEYSLNPHELLELHRAGAFVPLPRTVQPPFPDPMPFPVKPGYSRTASARAAASVSKPRSDKPSRSKSKSKNRKHTLKTEATTGPAATPSPLSPSSHLHGQLSATSSECESDQDIEDFEEIYGSPYAQPYFDGWAMVLRIRGLANKKGNDKGKGRDEETGVSRCESVNPSGPSTGSTGTETWRKMWIVVREGRISIRRQREDDEEESWFVGNCVGLYGSDKLKYLLGHEPPRTEPVHHHHHRPQYSTHILSEPSYRVSTTSRKSVRSGKDLAICAKFAEDSGGRWLFLKMLDPQSHEHLLRIIHRLAYTSPLRLPSIYPNPSRHSANHSISQSLSQNVDLSSLTPLTPFRPTTHTMRTLRTEFLPNPIPHPLALSFSAPSPLMGHDNGSDDDLPLLGGGRRRSLFDTTEFTSGDEIYGDEESTFFHAHPPVTSTQSSPFAMGLGPEMGVRFPEWREEVLIRAVNAGLGSGVGLGDLNRQEYIAHDHRIRKYTGGAEDSMGLRKQNLTRSSQDSRTSLHTDGASSLSETVVETGLTLGGLDDSDSDSDSEAESEREWEGWAYDLDRLKGVRYPRTRGGGGGSDGDYEYNWSITTPPLNETKSRRSMGRDRAKVVVAATPTPMPTPIASSGDTFVSSICTFQPASSNEVASSTTLSSNSTITAGSFQQNEDAPDSPVMSIPPSPLAAISPVTRVRSATVSDPRPSRSQVPLSTHQGHQPTSRTKSQATGPERPRTGEDSRVGMKNLMRGLSMKAGKESLMKGLENALDFVEGK